MDKLIIIFVFISSIICCASSYRILIVFPTPAPSHFFLGNALGRGLANAGHDVTMVSPYEDKNPPKKGKYRNIIITGTLEAMIEVKLPTWMDMGEMNLIELELLFTRLAAVMTNHTLNHPRFQELLNAGEKYDVIILEQFLNDGLKVLACHFNAPLIMLATFAPSFWINSASGNPSPLSYIPDQLLGYTAKMTLWQRLVNTVTHLIKWGNRDYIFMPSQIELIKQHFPQCSDVNNIYYNVSLTFTNYHESINIPVPLVPSVIPIGGYHLNPPDRLPKDLQEFMDNAKEGVIYLSLGSNVPSTLVSNFTKEAIIGALKKRKEKVLWKWDEEEFPGKPDNIFLRKWFPQQEILAHPNLKLFISHGGLLSITETVYHGVPILALPIFADQKMNGNVLEEEEYGLSILLNRATEEELTNRLDKLLTDPKYLQNVKKKSVLLSDRPIKPLDLAIYWTEYVARHKGAPHLRVGAMDLQWYQYLLLDVFAVIIGIAFFVITILKYFIKKLLKSNKKIKTN